MFLWLKEAIEKMDILFYVILVGIYLHSTLEKKFKVKQKSIKTSKKYNSINEPIHL